MAKATRKPAPKPIPAAAMTLNAFVGQVAEAVAQRLAITPATTPPSAVFEPKQTTSQGVLAATANKPAPPSLSEIIRVNHERASGLHSRLCALRARLKNDPPDNACTEGADSRMPGLNEYLFEEGQMLDAAHNVFSDIVVYLGIDV